MKWIVDDDGARTYVHIRQDSPNGDRKMLPLVAAVYVRDFAFLRQPPSDADVVEMHKTAQAIVDAHNAAEATSGNP